MTEHVKVVTDSKVTIVDFMGDDLRIQQAARVSTDNDSSDDELRPGLIKYLMDAKHTSTLEHNVVTFMVECPIFVAREFMRHRTMSYNEVSARYSKMNPVFYVESRERPLINAGNSARPNLVAGDIHDDEYLEFINDQIAVYEHAWAVYTKYLNLGYANEVCRKVLPVAIMTRFYVTANLNNWLKFLTLRDGLEGHPQYEIVQVANQIKEGLNAIYPIAMEHWNSKREPDPSELIAELLTAGTVRADSIRTNVVND